MKLRKLLKEDIYYHGTTLPVKNPTLDKFVQKTGYRSIMSVNYEVKNPWVFFTKNYDLAYYFGSQKTDSFYHSKGNFSYKTFVFKYDINESNLNILDLTNEDDYEFKLEDIGIKLYEYFGIGMYNINQMWEILDDEEISDKILRSGFNAVKVVEKTSSYNDYSLAIHISVVNDKIQKL